MMRFCHSFPLLVFGLVGISMGADELSRSTWEIPSHDDTVAKVENWIVESNARPEFADRVRAAWKEPVPATARLDLLASNLEFLGGEWAELIRTTLVPKATKLLPDVSFLEDTSVPRFQRVHARLIYARWLAQNQLYNETLEQIAALTTEDVIDPASLLFYQAIAHHRLLQKKECLPIVARLLEKEKELPRRFAILAAMVRDDIKPLEEDSLDEISRLMDNIQVRLGHGRAGKRVRTEEDDVIAKLDKMIKELEDKANSKSSASGQMGEPADSLNPAKPMEDSMPAGGRGEGNVDAKNIGNQQGWGNLPPKERQQALQQLGEDFPSHYRDVIQAYFRKLAQEDAEKP